MSNVIDLTMSDNDEAPTPARRRLRAVPAIRPPQIQAENLHGILYDTFYRQVVVAKPFPSPGYKPKLSHSFKVKSGEKSINT